MKAWKAGGVVALLAGSVAPQQDATELRPVEMGGLAAFGTGLVVEGSLALAGAPGENALGAESGAVHVLASTPGGWVEESVLLADDGAAGDELGASCALDGERALIGAPGHGGRGAAYVFRRQGGVWTQEAELSTASGGAGSRFGEAVALQGDTALIVDPFNEDEPEKTGSAYVFRWDGTAWTQEAELLLPPPSFGCAAFAALLDDTAFLTNDGGIHAFVPKVVHTFVRDDHDTTGLQDDTWSLLANLPIQESGAAAEGHGLPLAAHGDRLAVGVPLAGPASLGPGAVLVFERLDPGTPGEPLDDAWEQTSKIPAPEATENIRFGHAVALQGDRLLAGAPYDAPPGSTLVVGGAHLYRFDGAAWQVEASLYGAGPEPLKAFGWVVALGEEGALVTEQSDDLGERTGSVHVVEHTGGTWAATQKLLPAGLIRVGCFGCAVDVSSELPATAVVGAQLSETAGEEAGAAYVFRRGPAGWLQEARLLPAAVAPGDRFGSAVALDGDRILAGAHERDGAFLDQGSAFVFRRAGAGWIEEAELAPPAPFAFGYFGSAVALAGDVALIGAHSDGGAGLGAGAVYVFRFQGGAWALEAALHALDAAPGAHFGRSVSLEGARALIGAPDADLGQGAAYVFREQAGFLTQEARLAAADCAPLDRLGTSCAVSGDRALVGAHRASLPGGLTGTGAAYTFVRAPASGAWSEEQKITASFPIGGQNWLGASVALLGSAALVGAPGGYIGSGCALEGWVVRLALGSAATSPWIDMEHLGYFKEGVAGETGFAVAMDEGLGLVGSPRSLICEHVWDGSGAAFVQPLVSPGLVASPAALSTAEGGAQLLDLDAPLADAGRTYLVMGSLSGTDPGLTLGPWTLPLNPDTYFFNGLKEPDQAPAQDFLGVLDGLGDAHASVVLPPGLASAWAGTTVHHAFAVLELGQGAVTFVSNPAPLLLEP
jgi:hypothetical protein